MVLADQGFPLVPVPVPLSAKAQAPYLTLGERPPLFKCGAMWVRRYLAN
jgi:hypothetical protein